MEITNLFDLHNAAAAIDAIETKNGLFSSRDFIEKFIHLFESEYIDGLIQSRKEYETNVFRKYHCNIGSFLDKYSKEFNIKKMDGIKEESEAPSGELSETQVWIRL